MMDNLQKDNLLPEAYAIVPTTCHTIFILAITVILSLWLIIRFYKVSAKYCYAAHESRLHQNDRCKRFTLCLVLTVRFRSLAPWGKLFQLFI